MWWILEFLQISVAMFFGYFKQNFLEQMWRLASANCTRSWASSTKKIKFRTSWTRWLKLWSAKRARLHLSSQLEQQNVATSCLFLFLLLKNFWIPATKWNLLSWKLCACWIKCIVYWIIILRRLWMMLPHVWPFCTQLCLTCQNLHFGEWNRKFIWCYIL